MDVQPRPLLTAAVLPARVLLVVYWLALALATHWPRLELPVRDPNSVWQIDKLVHAVSFAGLCALLIAARPLGRGVGRAGNALAACLIAAVYSAVDEATQQFTGRDPSLSDAVANLIGILGAYLVVLGAAPSRRWPMLPVYGARALWLLSAPTLGLIAVLPAGNDLILWVIGLFTSPRLGMTHWLHFALALLVTWVLILAAPAGRSRPHLSVAVTIAFMAAAGPGIEQIQRYTGRGYSLNDAYFHFLGLLTALALWTVAVTIAALVRGRTARPPAPRDADAQ
ncbi:MAG: VanZ family protein [Phycisphaeraceae bacterium]